MQRIITFTLLLGIVLAFTFSGVYAAEGIAAGDLVRVTSQQGMSIHPTWSSDGQGILFVSDKDGGLAICKADASGKNEVSQVTRVSSPLISDFWIDTNQSGQIIFASTRESCGCRLYTMAPDAAKPVRIKTPVGMAQFPSWSSDGKRIAFSTYDDAKNWWVWTANADGSNAKKIARGIQPRWSPDGQSILYSSDAAIKDATGYDIYVINADGTEARRITTGKQNELEPDWSPDGKSIAYVSTSAEPAMPAIAKASSMGACDICVTNISNPSRDIKLTSGPSSNLHPRWSPDGKRILFSSDRSGNWDVWYMTLKQTQ